MKAGDIVKMIYDTGKRCLSYKINGKHLGIVAEKFNKSRNAKIAADCIEKAKDIQYRMVWKCNAMSDCLQILSFEMKLYSVKRLGVICV